MLIKTRGIVFRQQRYGETSLIVDIYTEAKGLQSYIISGVRKKRATVSAALLQLMSLVEIVAYYRDDRQKLNRVKEIRPSYIYKSIPFELKKGAVGMFMIEVARKAIREAEEHQALFEYLNTAFKDLDETPLSVSFFHLHFLLGLTSFLGFKPSGIADGETPFFDLKEGGFFSSPPSHSDYLNVEESELISKLLWVDRNACAQIQSSRVMRQAILRHLIRYYQLHLENFPDIQSHEILEDVLG